jgi:hypothetical protein
MIAQGVSAAASAARVQAHARSHAAAVQPGVLATIGHAIASGASEVASTTVTLSERALAGLEHAGKAAVGLVEEVVGTADTPGLRSFASAAVDDVTNVASDMVKYAALGAASGILL